jgi:hypothetical protein
MRIVIGQQLINKETYYYDNSHCMNYWDTAIIITAIKTNSVTSQIKFYLEEHTRRNERKMQITKTNNNRRLPQIMLFSNKA